MRIAARMALQSAHGEEGRGLPAIRAQGYDGIDVVVGAISERGFTAETSATFPPQAFVRLKLPGVGAVYARIVSATAGRVAGEFVTPLATARLQRTIGLKSAFAS